MDKAGLRRRDVTPWHYHKIRFAINDESLQSVHISVDVEKLTKLTRDHRTFNVSHESDVTKTAPYRIHITANMSANTNTTALNAENASTANTYQNTSVNSAASQGLGGGSTNSSAGYGSTAGAGVDSSIGREANATGTAATHAGTGRQTIGGGDAPTTHGGGIGHQIKGVFAQGHVSNPQSLQSSSLLTAACRASARC